MDWRQKIQWSELRSSLWEYWSILILAQALSIVTRNVSPCQLRHPDFWSWIFEVSLTLCVGFFSCCSHSVLMSLSFVAAEYLWSRRALNEYLGTQNPPQRGYEHIPGVHTYRSDLLLCKAGNQTAGDSIAARSQVFCKSPSQLPVILNTHFS